jgi:energy-coupling factor transporter ATP-binding protein EcfA2
MEAAVILALARRSVVTLHAVAFALGGRNVAAVGASGSGKSTLAAAVMAAGGRVVTDDSVLVRLANDEVAIAPFRTFLSFRGNSAALLPDPIRRHLRRRHDAFGPTSSLYRHDCPDHTVDLLTPCDVWALSLDRRRGSSRFDSISHGECLAAVIAETSPLFLSPRYPTERARLMPVLTRLVESTSAGRVRLGKDLTADPVSTVERLLSS